MLHRDNDMTLYSAFMCWLIFNELFVLAALRRHALHEEGSLSRRLLSISTLPERPRQSMSPHPASAMQQESPPVG
jgi:hypothetical protein